jgi:predicted MFS family arabinose efflux permease
VLLSGALVCLVLAAEVPDEWALLLAAAGIALLVPFVLVERRVADPVVSFGLFRDVRFTAGTLVIALLNLVMYALVFEIPLVVDHTFHLSPERTGRLLIFLMLAMVLTSLVAGRLTDRFGPRPLGLLGVLTCLLGLVLMRVLPMDAATDLRLPLALLGVGLGLANPAAQAASMAGIARVDSGMAAGIGSTMRYLGGVVGIALLGRVIDGEDSVNAVLAQHDLLLTVFTGVLVATFVCAALLGRKGGTVPA